MTHVKVCGITNLYDAQLALRLGAWALGFNFYKKSLRFISPFVARDIIQCLSADVKKVGIFVNASLDEIHAICETVDLDMVQLHGDETPEYCQKLNMPIIKALRPKTNESLTTLSDWESVEALLIDGYSPTAFGGTGQLANWDYAKYANQFFKTILAGGLQANNCLAAIHAVKPYAIDVCSGVEVCPGKKSPQKLENFFQTIKQNEKLYACNDEKCCPIAAPAKHGE